MEFGITWEWFKQIVLIHLKREGQAFMERNYADLRKDRRNGTKVTAIIGY